MKEPTRRNLLIGIAANVLAKPLPAVAVDPITAGTVPRRAVGVNYFDLFYRTIYQKKAERIGSKELRRLVDRGIPFARFSASPFWPNDWKASYFADPARYMARLDDVFEAAADAGLGLVPTIVWAPAYLSDALGEPVSAWEAPQSRTRAFMRDYTRTIIERYHDSPVLWFWEAFNEFNAFTDFPGSTRWWPRVDVKQGTPPTRTEADWITSEGQAEVIDDFARVVDAIDHRHRICSGSSVPRPNHYRSFKKIPGLDTREEYRRAVLRATPKIRGVASIHLYDENENKYFADRRSPMRELLAQFVQAAREAGVPSFLGEFGTRRSGDLAADERRFSAFVDDVLASEVDYAAVWVYDFTFQDALFNVTLQNDRVAFLDRIAAANERISGR